MQTLFVLNHYVTARDDRVFAEAERFIPERWLRADSTVDMEGDGSSSTADTFSDNLRQRYAFSCLPFGYGNRSCLGQFAVTSLTLLFLSANLAPLFFTMCSPSF